LDLHADQCTVGSNTLIVHNYEQPINIQGYDPNGPVKDSLQTVSVALTYDHQCTGTMIILIVKNQAIAEPHFEHNLLPTMQLRLNDIQVNNIPKFLTEKPTAVDHAIIVTGTDPDDKFIIPLSSIDGVTSTFPTRKQNPKEYEHCCPQYELTYDSPHYEPSDHRFTKQEAMMANWVDDTLLQTGDHPQTCRLCSVSKSMSNARQVVEANNQCNSILQDVLTTLTDSTFLHDLENVASISSIKTLTRREGIDAETLAQNWGIGLETARQTVRVTTQRGVTMVLHPTLSRHFRHKSS
jgi:hypothetical protein